MQEHDKDFMKIAIELSLKNIEQGGGPFGAVIVKDGKIISQASNSVTANNYPTAHAEINAIRAACSILKKFDLSGCMIYTSCEPCPMCLGAIYWARISTIFYANTRSDAANIGFIEIRHTFFRHIIKTLDCANTFFLALECTERAKIGEVV